MKFTAAVALASACVVVWCAVGAARKGAGSRERPRPSFVPFIDMPSSVDGWARL